ncbi:hypothetical protein ASE01_12455 [Nocardioides sp. Root190]|uniref:Ig-like domain-containing protein n=1 Tax=Nocardioides sp. Root190 TaxID=1736488 RepID=UPI0007011E02|nr:Ig-like domain-containing protein [Nocardioides sp. Root190]KRB75862.1 hypothetical protein ASE01_12455 [Nocardioides sp. Root190]
MNHRTLLRRGATAGTAFALALSPLLGISSPARAEDPAPTTYPTPTHGATVDWFDDKYPDLEPGSVFETVTFERFEYLLKKNTGKWAFLIGGPEDASLQEAIGHIDDVARAEGIEKIYNFDPNLDGEDLSVFDLTGYDLYSADNAGKDQFLDLGERLVTSYLGKDAETPFTLANDVAKPDQRVADTHPYFFVYDAAGGDTARIVDALVTPPSDLDSPSAVAAYKADVKRVLDSTDVGVDSQWDFLSAEHNRRHHERYVKNTDPAVETLNRKRFGGDIFEAGRDLSGGDEDDFRIESITHPELLNILDTEGDFVLLFGGTWCHNTAAIIQQTHEYARRHGIKKVYNFDFSLDSTGNGGSLDKHIRDNAFRTVSGVARQTRPSHLYGQILEKLSNASTQYKVLASEAGTQSLSPVRYYDNGTVPDPAVPATGEKLARKIQVGHVLSYNKGRTVEGQPAPVIDQAIRKDWTNPADSVFTGNTEYMTEVWFTQGHDLAFDAADADNLRGSVNVTAETGQNALRNQRNFAKEALHDIRDVIADVADGYDSDVTVTGAPASVSVEAPGNLTAQITVASDYTGFYSDRTVNATLAPLTGNRTLGGSVQVFLDSTKLGEVDVDADRVVDIDLPIGAVTAGQHTLRYVYGGGAQDLVSGSELEQDLEVVAKTSTTTLGAAPSLTYGAGGTITATVTTGATGTVSLAGIPGGALSAPLVDGVATFQVPSSVPAGTHPLTATYAGNGTYAASTSASVDLVVAKALTISQASSVTTTYGKSGVLKVKVISPGTAVSGPVTLTGVGATQTKQLVNGAVSFTVPRTLLVKKYSAKLAFAGDANFNGSQAQVSYTVAKVAPSKVAVAVTKVPTSKATGSLKSVVNVPSGLKVATGKITVVLQKSGSSKTIVKTLSSKGATLVLPKLAKGTWRVTVKYSGDANYKPATAAVVNLKVTR